jgi:hypothetical protein
VDLQRRTFSFSLWLFSLPVLLFDSSGWLILFLVLFPSCFFFFFFLPFKALPFLHGFEAFKSQRLNVQAVTEKVSNAKVKKLGLDVSMGAIIGGMNGVWSVLDSEMKGYFTSKALTRLRQFRDWYIKKLDTDKEKAFDKLKETIESAKKEYKELTPQPSPAIDLKDAAPKQISRKTMAALLAAVAPVVSTKLKKIEDLRYTTKDPEERKKIETDYGKAYELNNQISLLLKDLEYHLAFECVVTVLLGFAEPFVSSPIVEKGEYCYPYWQGGRAVCDFQSYSH